MIEEIITQFKGKTFSSHDEVVAWLKEKLTSFEREILENYSRWLEKHSYIDSDWWSEGNTVNEFLKIK